MAGVEDDGAPAQAVTRAADQLALAQDVGGAAGDRATQVLEGAQRVGTDRSVAGQPIGALEAAHGPLGLGTEPAIDPTGGETEGVESFLERDDVLASQEVAWQVHEDPVAERPAGPVDGRERLDTHDAVDDEALVLLEGADGPFQRGVETRRVEPVDTGAARAAYFRAVAGRTEVGPFGKLVVR